MAARDPRKVPTKVSVEKVRVLYKGFEDVYAVTIKQRTGTREYQVADHGDGASVLAYDSSRKVAIVIRQKRAPLAYLGIDEALLEIPGGLVEDDGPAASATRELFEEAGIRVSQVDHLGTFWPMPGISTERAHIYLAEYGIADRISAGGGLLAEGEEIEVVEIPLKDLAALADAGKLTDLRTYVAVEALRKRARELF